MSAVVEKWPRAKAPAPEQRFETDKAAAADDIRAVFDRLAMTHGIDQADVEHVMWAYVTQAFRDLDLSRHARLARR
jgi:hypothetical protein